MKQVIARLPFVLVGLTKIKAPVRDNTQLLSVFSANSDFLLQALT